MYPCILLVIYIFIFDNYNKIQKEAIIVNNNKQITIQNIIH